MRWYPVTGKNTPKPDKAGELVNQSITDIQCLLNYMVCETSEMQAHCEEMLNNIANQLGRAFDMMKTAPVIINCFRNSVFINSQLSLAENIEIRGGKA